VNAIGYVAGLMVIDALKHIDGEVTKEALTAALRKTDIAASPLGPVKFDDKGERTGDKLVVIGVIKNGKASFVTRL
jgi:ABC-type branched-subunit amino acid transport system substrate-binding protein